MRIRSGWGSTFFEVVGCVGAVMASICSARDATEKQENWHLDFEKYVPGQAPREWKHLWGNQGDDLISVTSDYTSCGKRALLFDHPDGDNSMAQWGASTTFPALPESGGTLQWDFLYIGMGGDARFSFEIRNRSSKCVARVAVGYQHVNFDATAQSLKVAVRPGIWYRVQITAACGGEIKGREVSLRLRELLADTWLIEESLTGKEAAPVESARSICLCLFRTSGPYRVYVDNVMTSSVTDRSL